MRDSRPQSLDSLFDNATQHKMLENLQQRAIALIKINRTVQALLPSSIQPWCRVANFRQGLLVLEAASASWMMRLKYERPNLLSALRAEILPSLTSIDIRINPSLMTNGEKKVQEANNFAKNDVLTRQTLPTKRVLSQKAAEQLKWLANRSPEKLKEKLKRLAKLAGESTNVTSRYNK